MNNREISCDQLRPAESACQPSWLSGKLVGNVSNDDGKVIR